MMRKPMQLTVLAGLLAAGSAVAGGAQWGYSGDTGPAHWGELSGKFERCGDGRNQSPIDLTAMVDAELSPLGFDYAAAARSMVNNGHTVKAEVASGGALTVDGHSYALKQFHFHSPSENRIQGESFAMEGHFVHADADGNLAVVSVMYRKGDENAAMGKLWQALPMETGVRNALEGDAAVLPADLLPEGRDYYRFNGSLTTPPCSEGVLWLVMKEPVTVSPEQVAAFREAMGGHDNNRPIQPRNARAVME